MTTHRKKKDEFLFSVDVKSQLESSLKEEGIKLSDEELTRWAKSLLEQYSNDSASVLQGNTEDIIDKIRDEEALANPEIDEAPVGAGKKRA